jgi:hypothetical protein
VSDVHAVACFFPLHLRGVLVLHSYCSRNSYLVHPQGTVCDPYLTVLG